jgi:hypothetical protein
MADLDPMLARREKETEEGRSEVEKCVANWSVSTMPLVYVHSLRRKFDTHFSTTVNAATAHFLYILKFSTFFAIDSCASKRSWHIL